MMRVGVVSPNVLYNINDAACGSQDQPWLFDSLTKRASLLFDKIYITDDIDLTCEIIGGPDPFEEGPEAGTLRYLVQRGVILVPQDLGCSSREAFLRDNLKGAAVKIHRELLKVGNPSNNCAPGEDTYVGQPDIGDFEAHDGNHPRSSKGWNDPYIKTSQIKYESLLLRRNVAMLRQAGATDVATFGRLYKENESEYSQDSHPVWKVIIREMPNLDSRAPWEEVLCFRAESRTQHLVRSLRRWIRKVVTEEWTQSELEDEIRELVYEYESHLHMARIRGTRGVLRCIITGTAELTENVVKLRLGKLADLVSAVLDRGTDFLEAEIKSPGRELALIPELKKRF
jgi:hypothetical protein